MLQCPGVPQSRSLVRSLAPGRRQSPIAARRISQALPGHDVRLGCVEAECGFSPPPSLSRRRRDTPGSPSTHESEPPSHLAPLSRAPPFTSLPDLFYQHRILFAGPHVDSWHSQVLVGSLLSLERESAVLPVTLALACASGDLGPCLALLDALRHVACPVNTLGVGQVHGPAALLLAGGARGQRRLLARASVSLAGAWGRHARGQAALLANHAGEVLAAHEFVAALVAQAAGQSPARVRRDVDRGVVLSAGEALQYGLVDAVVDESSWGEREDS